MDNPTETARKIVELASKETSNLSLALTTISFALILLLRLHDLKLEDVLKERKTLENAADKVIALGRENNASNSGQ